MTQMIGANVAELRELAQQFRASADRLLTLAAGVSNGIKVSAWVGPFAANFKLAWDSEHSVRLRAVAQALDERATALIANANDQESASAGIGGTSSCVIAAAKTATGGSHSPRNMGKLARIGYDEKTELPDGWSTVSEQDLLDLGIDPSSLHDQVTGFDAYILGNEDGSYVVVFGGTRSLMDLATDVHGTNTVFATPQTKQAVALALKLKNVVGAENVSYTGHSLGGRLAAVASIATGSTAVTFDAAGVSVAEMEHANVAGGGMHPGLQDRLATNFVDGNADAILVGADTSHITNYYAVEDPLTNTQLEGAAPDALGDQIAVVTPCYEDPLKRHGLDEMSSYLP